eukprot:TRINITY_DN10942_c0_g3_i15.p1 TRINITY_DN10942_c0_g3~~TRINITY_DN10942_c0_g3_i15.p1  ORF type:complete len:262 (-),score=49.85 TRINITY_DN10942_c0_g3_i15:9-794(-)
MVAVSVVVIVTDARQSYEVQYFGEESSACKGGIGTPCNFTITVTKRMDGPVYVFYRLAGVFQNYQSYLQSRDRSQSLGGDLKNKDYCSPVITNKDANKNVSWAGEKLNPSDVANPCGLMAYTLFSDNFTIVGPQGSSAKITSKNIAWSVDRENAQRPPNSSKVQWVDTTDERYLVWMRPSPLPDFKKLWGRIEEGLDAGRYTVMVDNRYDLTKNGGKKYLYLTTLDFLGGDRLASVSYTHLRAHETGRNLVCRLLLEKKKQ